MGVRGPLDVGMGMWPEYRPHQIDRVLPEPVVESFRACARPDVGRYSPSAYSLPRSGNRHCYGEGAQALEEV